MKRNYRVVIIIFIAVVIITGVALFIPWNNLLHPEQEGVPLQAQESQISYYMNRNAGYDFCTHISLAEQTDSDGNPYYVGILDPELDGMLTSLVDAYNADPSTAKHITVDTVRYNLTEGIIEATSKNVDDSAFAHFLRWCKEPADLVWKKDGISDSGVKHAANDPVNQKTISNFRFVLNREDPSSSDFKYSWE